MKPMTVRRAPTLDSIPTSQPRQIDQMNQRAQRDGWRSGNMIYIIMVA